MHEDRVPVGVEHGRCVATGEVLSLELDPVGSVNPIGVQTALILAPRDRSWNLSDCRVMLHSPPMAQVIRPWQVFVIAAAGWISRHQDAVIEYLREENREKPSDTGYCPRSPRS